MRLIALILIQLGLVAALPIALSSNLQIESAYHSDLNKTVSGSHVHLRKRQDVSGSSSSLSSSITDSSSSIATTVTQTEIVTSSISDAGTASTALQSIISSSASQSSTSTTETQSSTSSSGTQSGTLSSDSQSSTSAAISTVASVTTAASIPTVPFAYVKFNTSSDPTLPFAVSMQISTSADQSEQAVLISSNTIFSMDGRSCVSVFVVGVPVSVTSKVLIAAQVDPLLSTVSPNVDVKSLPSGAISGDDVTIVTVDLSGTGWIKTPQYTSFVTDTTSAINAGTLQQYLSSQTQTSHVSLSN